MSALCHKQTHHRTAATCFSVFCEIEYLDGYVGGASEKIT